MKGLAVIIGKSVHKNQDQVDEGPDSPQPAQKQADDTGTPFPHIHPMNAENAEEQAEDECHPFLFGSGIGRFRGGVGGVAAGGRLCGGGGVVPVGETLRLSPEIPAAVAAVSALGLMAADGTDPWAGGNVPGAGIVAAAAAEPPV